MADKKIIDESSPISKKRRNGLIRCQVWTDGNGKVTRYNLAYINHSLQHQDNGRVVGYDNHHVHHRHHMGKVEVVTYELMTSKSTSSAIGRCFWSNANP